jgi:hypothetical protein
MTRTLPVVIIAMMMINDEGLTVETVEVEGAWDPATSLHCFITCTRGSPFGPVIGVNVIVHV